MKKSVLQKISILFAILFLAVLCSACSSGDTAEVERAEFVSDNEIQVYLSGTVENYRLSVNVNENGKEQKGYYVKSYTYNPFYFRLTAELNKNVPKGAFLTITGEDDLFGKVTIKNE